MSPNNDTRRELAPRLGARALRARTALGAILLLGALLFAMAALVPSRYVAVARVLTPPMPFDAGPLAARASSQDISVSGERGSRVLSLEHTAPEPRAAA